jgi:hypothetical protein
MTIPDPLNQAAQLSAREFAFIVKRDVTSFV